MTFLHVKNFVVCNISEDTNYPNSRDFKVSQFEIFKICVGGSNLLPLLRLLCYVYFQMPIHVSSFFKCSPLKRRVNVFLRPPRVHISISVCLFVDIKIQSIFFDVSFDFNPASFKAGFISFLHIFSAKRCCSLLHSVGYNSLNPHELKSN